MLISAHSPCRTCCRGQLLGVGVGGQGLQGRQGVCILLVKTEEEEEAKAASWASSEGLVGGVWKKSRGEPGSKYTLPWKLLLTYFFFVKEHKKLNV